MNLKCVVKELYFGYQRLKCPWGLKYIGRGSTFRKPMRILGKECIYIGSSCHIMDGMRIEAVSKWNGKDMETPPDITIQNCVVIGQNCHFTCANKLFIGEGTSIMPDVLITDIKHISERNKSLRDTDILVGSVTIGKYVQIGMGARIMANGHNLVIGDNAIIGANAVVTQNVEENTTVVGIPARKV